MADLEQQWLKSQQANNPDLIAPHLADKIVATQRRQGFGQSWCCCNDKKTKYTSAECEDVKVTVFGNTAIATGGFKGKGTDPEGKPFETYERWTDTWLKMPNGQWQCVATQSTPVKMLSTLSLDQYAPGNIVTTPRSDVMYLVTEYGMVNLKGKSIAEHAQAIIGLAHPDFREELEREAYERRLIPRGVSFGCRRGQPDHLHKANTFS